MSTSKRSINPIKEEEKAKDRILMLREAGTSMSILPVEIIIEEILAYLVAHVDFKDSSVTICIGSDKTVVSYKDDPSKMTFCLWGYVPFQRSNLLLLLQNVRYGYLMSGAPISNPGGTSMMIHRAEMRGIEQAVVSLIPPMSSGFDMPEEDEERESRLELERGDWNGDVSLRGEIFFAQELRDCYIIPSSKDEYTWTWPNVRVWKNSLVVVPETKFAEEVEVIEEEEGEREREEPLWEGQFTPLKPRKEIKKMYKVQNLAPTVDLSNVDELLLNYTDLYTVTRRKEVSVGTIVTDERDEVWNAMVVKFLNAVQLSPKVRKATLLLKYVSGAPLNMSLWDRMLPYLTVLRLVKVAVVELNVSTLRSVETLEFTKVKNLPKDILEHAVMPKLKRLILNQRGLSYKNTEELFLKLEHLECNDDSSVICIKIPLSHLKTMKYKCSVRYTMNYWKAMSSLTKLEMSGDIRNLEPLLSIRGRFPSLCDLIIDFTKSRIVKFPAKLVPLPTVMKVTLIRSPNPDVLFQSEVFPNVRELIINNVNHPEITYGVDWTGMKNLEVLALVAPDPDRLSVTSERNPTRVQYPSFVLSEKSPLSQLVELRAINIDIVWYHGEKTPNFVNLKKVVFKNVNISVLLRDTVNLDNLSDVTLIEDCTLDWLAKCPNVVNLTFESLKMMITEKILKPMPWSKLRVLKLKDVKFDDNVHWIDTPNLIEVDATDCIDLPDFRLSFAGTTSLRANKELRSLMKDLTKRMDKMKRMDKKRIDKIKEEVKRKKRIKEEMKRMEEMEEAIKKMTKKTKKKEEKKEEKK